MTSSRWLFIHPFQLRLRRGIESYLWNLAAALAHSGVQAEILAWQGALPVPDFVSQAGVIVRTVPRARYFEAVFAALYYPSILLRGNYDHVFVHFAGYGEGPALQLVQWFRRQPFSIVFHFPPDLVPHRYREFECWGFPATASQMIAVSQFLATEIQSRWKRPCQVIGHGVDASLFRPDDSLRAITRQRLDIGEPDPVLISVAALEERKGMQWAIRALPEVLSRFPRTWFLILGEGSYRDDLQSLVAGLGLAQQVKLLGSVADVPAYLAAADLALLLSQGEASPVALFEYAAAGLPVITSARPPFGELVQPAWGHMLSPENPVELANVIASLLASSEKRMHMGEAARSWAIQEHSWDIIARQYLETLDRRSP